MDIRPYKPNAAPSVELLDLLSQKYGTSKNFSFFLNDFNKAFAFCASNERVTFFPIAAYVGGTMAAHLALIIDNRRPTGEAFFGFLETPNDPRLFAALWQALTKEAGSHGITALKGPINGSIWHQYRVIKESDGSDFFTTELPTELHSYSLLKAQSPTVEISYHSAYRTHFEKILELLAAGKPAYEKLTAAGFTVSEATTVTAKDLEVIGELSKNIFEKSWGYTRLTESEFLQLYSQDKITAQLSRLYLLRKGEQIIGFCSTLKEDDSTVIFKTIGIAPEFQAMGLGSFFAYRLHLDAQAQGVKKIIYALIRDDNRVKNFPMDDIVFFRRYSALEFKL